MTRWDGLNRRKFPRVQYPCLVIIRDTATGEKKVILTHTENIGMGGICVILKQDVKTFSDVEVELDLLDLKDHIKCSGKVVWNVLRSVNAMKKPLFYDIGIEFEGLSDADHERLEDVVKLLLKHNKEVPEK